MERKFDVVIRVHHLLQYLKELKKLEEETESQLKELSEKYRIRIENYEVVDWGDLWDWMLELKKKK